MSVASAPHLNSPVNSLMDYPDQDVFISYSRSDKTFVKLLHEKLRIAGRGTWVDWEDIPITAEWWREIEAGIESTNTFIFIISPDSVKSKVCRQEIDHAVFNHKRLLPIVWREGFDQEQVHPALRRHNWLFFRENDDFNPAFQSLIKALDTDLDHVKTHTRLLVRANEWVHKRCNESFLLRGSDLEEAEQWLTKGADKEPFPAQVQREYIIQSRRAETERQKAENRRQKIALVSVSFALCVAGIFGLVAFSQWQKAERRQLSSIATTSEALFSSNQVFDALIESLRAGTTLDRSIWTRDDQLRSEVVTLLQQSVYWVREHNTLEGHSETVWGVSFSPDGQTLGTASWDGTAKIWSADGRESITLQGHSDRINNISFSPDGQRIATGSFDQTMKLWSRDGHLLHTFQGHSQGVWDVSFSPDGTVLATTSQDGTAKLWRSDGKLLATLEGHTDEVHSVSFSPDGQTLATASRDKTVKLWTVEGQPIRTIASHNGAVWDVSFSPDGRTLATAGNDNALTLWNLDYVGDLQELVTRGCDWVQDYLETNPSVEASDRKICS